RRFDRSRLPTATGEAPRSFDSSCAALRATGDARRSRPTSAGPSLALRPKVRRRDTHSAVRRQEYDSSSHVVLFPVTDGLPAQPRVVVLLIASGHGAVGCEPFPRANPTSRQLSRSRNPRFLARQVSGDARRSTWPMLTGPAGRVLAAPA